MAKRSLPRRKADSSQLISAALVKVRVKAVEEQLAPIKAQLHVIAAASQSMEGASSADIEQCHLTAAIEALIRPCERLYELVDELSMCRPASAEEQEEAAQIEAVHREAEGARS